MHIHNINLTGHKKCMLPAALGLPEDIAHRSASTLEIEDFS